jgi:hypothetical protein
MEASQHSLLAACFTLHSINATLAIVPQRGAGLWISENVTSIQSCIRLVSNFYPKFRYILPKMLMVRFKKNINSVIYSISSKKETGF